MMTKGEIIKKLRIEKKVSQDDLAYLICNTSTLSKIENGSQEPRWLTFCELIERLGEDPQKYADVMSDREKKAIDLEYTIMECLSFEKYEDAKKYLDKLKKIQKPDKGSRKFIKITQIMLDKFNHSSPKNAIETSQEAIKAIEEAFGYAVDKDLDRKLFSRQDLRILNFLAFCYCDVDLDHGIDIYYTIKEYIEDTVSDKSSFVNLYTGVAYNLSKQIFTRGEYKESLDIVEEGIEWCEKYNRHFAYPGLLLGKAMLLIEMKIEQEEVIELLYLSYLLYKRRGDKVCENIKSYAKDKGIEIKIS